MIFEKGLDPNNAYDASNRACELIEELNCGEVVGGIVDVHSELPTERTLPFDPAWINDFLGTDISMEDMVKYLEKLELKVDTEAMTVTVPTFRQDLEGEADIAEEVARFFGYANIPTTLPKGEATTGKLPFDLKVQELARRVAMYHGFSQAMTYSFESPKVFDKLMIAEKCSIRKAITIVNPLGEDFSIMRTLPLNGLLTSLALNYNHRNKNVRLFEMAKIYIPKDLPLTELPDERVQFTLGFYGDGDFYDMKGVVEEFFAEAGLTGRLHYDPAYTRPFLHPGRKAAIMLDGEKLGYLGELHPQVADNYGIGECTYIAVLDMLAVVPHCSFDRKYEGIAKFPAVNRDISMVMDKTLLAGQIEDVIVEKGGKLLETCKLFDVYEGSQIEEGKKSMAYTITFRAKDHTLGEEEITGVMNKILNALKELGAELRS